MTITSETLARWRDDVRGAEVQRLLAQAGVRSVVLKGAGFATVFPPEGERGRSADLDLLVEPGALAAASAALQEHGYRPKMLAADAMDPSGVHAGVWSVPGDYFEVDLHHSLPELATDPARVWKVLEPHVVGVELGGAATLTLGRTAAAALAALHAAHHPGTGKAWADLDRVIRQLEPERWLDVHHLLTDLGGVEPFCDAMTRADGGAEILDRLDLAGAPTVGRRLRWAGEPWGAAILADLRDTPTLASRLALARRVLVPTPRAMRHHHSHLAARGPAGLALAYAVRPFRLLLRLPEAIRILRRHTRADERR